MNKLFAHFALLLGLIFLSTITSELIQNKLDKTIDTLKTNNYIPNKLAIQLYQSFFGLKIFSFAVVSIGIIYMFYSRVISPEIK